MKLQFDTHGNAKQKETARYWTDNITTDIVYGGSKGSGKSFLGVSLIFGDALIYPGTSYFIARKTAADLRKHTIPSIHEVLGLWGVPDKMYRYNGQDNYYTLYNKSRVLLLDAKYLPSDPLYARFGSMQMTRGWAEEAGEIEEAAKNNLAASLGRWMNDVYGLTPKLLQTCNPAKNYLYRDYYKKHREGKLEPHKRFVQALPTDNSMLPAGYLENLNKILSPNEKERLLYGNWEYDDDPSALIEYDAIIDMFRNEHIVGDGKRYITADIARFGRDSTVIMVWDGFRVVKLVEIGKSGVDQSAETIRTLANEYKIPVSKIVVDEDGVGGGVVDILKCKGFVNNSRPIETESAKKLPTSTENYANLKSQCYYLLADKVNRREVYITCRVTTEQEEKIISDLEQVKQHNMDRDGKKAVLPKENIKELIGRSPDFSDALMMRMYFTLQKKTNWYVAA